MLILGLKAKFLGLGLGLALGFSGLGLELLGYGDCLEVKREYYQNSSLLDCVTQCSQSTTHLCEQFLQVK